jgi:hypothetical protein
MVFSGTDLGFIVSKEGKVMDLKKVEALVNMPIPTTPQEIQVFNEIAQFYRCFKKTLLLQSCRLSLSCSKKLKSLNGLKNAKMLRRRFKNQYIQTPVLINPK